LREKCKKSSTENQGVLKVGLMPINKPGINREDAKSAKKTFLKLRVLPSFAVKDLSSWTLRTP
jgi:hypothetical protein